jgi:hypothetical protein
LYNNEITRLVNEIVDELVGIMEEEAKSVLANERPILQMANGDNRLTGSRL